MCVHVACGMFYTVFDTVFYMPAYYMLLTIYRLLYIIRILLTAYYREKTVNWWKVKMMRR